MDANYYQFGEESKPNADVNPLFNPSEFDEEFTDSLFDTGENTHALFLVENKVPVVVRVFSSEYYKLINEKKSFAVGTEKACTELAEAILSEL